ncbi:hypothetical protein BDP81DRAFT_130325 [Colletotrichum phormii]|uniref:Uncharacterized protein n=1 Tax=Colletotrichum phormii TaxID=359342 RepID=A0AAJ0A2I2_9PEZI|nr:uncharacterized protein BDP81DRAFT_130325 [Colletotrichum phormii]KAK1641264.1 hypothetical protein BDP81DRAFT_130325 [Colletotrichum phormii]
MNCYGYTLFEMKNARDQTSEKPTRFQSKHVKRGGSFSTIRDSMADDPTGLPRARRLDPSHAVSFWRRRQAHPAWRFEKGQSMSRVPATRMRTQVSSDLKVAIVNAVVQCNPLCGRTRNRWPGDGTPRKQTQATAATAPCVSSKLKAVQVGDKYLMCPNTSSFEVGQIILDESEMGRKVSSKGFSKE